MKLVWLVSIACSSMIQGTNPSVDKLERTPGSTGSSSAL
jgi:hypothetical protein